MMTLHVLRSDSVDKLKEAINEQQGIEPAVQRLIFGGKQLEDGKTLRHYGIGPDMTIHLGELSFGRLPDSLTDRACDSPPPAQWLIIAGTSLDDDTSCLTDD